MNDYGVDPKIMAAYRARTDAAIESEKRKLRKLASTYAPLAMLELMTAMLQIAIDDLIELLGPADAHESLEGAYLRRVDTYRRRLN